MFRGQAIAYEQVKSRAAVIKAIKNQDKLNPKHASDIGPLVTLLEIKLESMKHV